LAGGGKESEQAAKQLTEKEGQRGEVGIVSGNCQQIESKKSGIEKSGGAREREKSKERKREKRRA
jgi:hypothetical protein